jgi:hypothetical protein
MKIEIIDVLGKKVHEQFLTQKITDLRIEVLPGAYYVRLSDKTSVAVKKIIVE